MQDTVKTADPLPEKGVDDPLGIDSQIDLLEYLVEIYRRKYKIGAIALLASIIALGLSFLKDNIYLATAVVGINSNEKPGGVSPKDFRSTNAIGLLEYDFIIQAPALNEKERMLARMNSVRFSALFIKENNLIPYIYHKHWDEETKSWKKDFKPDEEEAITIFREQIRSVSLQEKTGLLHIYFKTRSPELSAKLANRFVKRFNEYVQENALREIAERREYLEGQLIVAKNVEIQRSIYRLLEAQLAAETFSHTGRDFPLEEIQPARPPAFKDSPKRLTQSALTFLGVTFLSITFIIGNILVKKIMTNLKKYSPAPQSAGKQKPAQSTFRNTEVPDDWVDN